ncbi:MAG: hypothetical protein HYZ00_07555 [Candidatus Hydrogenedentes bacterium]|nr:hypothetical protein [Candidatus Hydrogenedentota bacterium]
MKRELQAKLLESWGSMPFEEVQRQLANWLATSDHPLAQKWRTKTPMLTIRKLISED